MMEAKKPQTAKECAILNIVIFILAFAFFSFFVTGISGKFELNTVLALCCAVGLYVNVLIAFVEDKS